MIKSLSPYYLYIPFIAPISGLTATSFTLQIFVWNGLKNVVPAAANYEVTIDNVTSSTGSHKIDISLLVNDFIDFTPFDTTTTELIDGFNQYWVKTQVLYITTDPDDNVPNLEETILMTAGYGYGMDGENSQIPTNNILLSGAEFKVNRDGFFVLPILIEESSPAASEFATITSIAGGCVTWVFNIPYPYTALTIQTSTDSGVTWINSTGTPVSPRCSFTFASGEQVRLRSEIGPLYYSNIITAP